MALKTIIIGLLATCSFLGCQYKNRTTTATEPCSNGSFQKSEPEIIFKAQLANNSANSKLYEYSSPDSLLVLFDVSERLVYVVLKSKDNVRDTFSVSNVNNICKIEVFKFGNFGFEVEKRCGSNCEIREFYLLENVNGKIHPALAFQSYAWSHFDRAYDDGIDSTYVIDERSEYIASMLNLDENLRKMRIYETQNEEYHYYKREPFNFAKEYLLAYDSLNAVYCNDHVSLSGEYECVSDIDYSRETRKLNSRNTPCFRSLKHTYIFLEGRWAILNEEGKNEIVFMN